MPYLPRLAGCVRSTLKEMTTARPPDESSHPAPRGLRHLSTYPFNGDKRYIIRERGSPGPVRHSLDCLRNNCFNRLVLQRCEQLHKSIQSKLSFAAPIKLLDDP